MPSGASQALHVGVTTTPFSSRPWGVAPLGEEEEEKRGGLCARPINALNKDFMMLTFVIVVSSSSSSSSFLSISKRLSSRSASAYPSITRIQVYELTGLISSFCFKGYANLNTAERIEWNNRGISSFHAVIVTAVSFYLLVISGLFKDHSDADSLICRTSPLSNTMLGISIGYFLSDLGMILWLFPALGGKEYIVHHGVSIYSICLSLLSGKGHIYIHMILISECTTPFINLRWYLDLAGFKSSKLYLYNGVAMFLIWMVARILLFIYFYVHIYVHYDQVKTVFPLGFYSLLTVSPVLATMNVYWFWKIFNGMMKIISKKEHAQ